MKSPAFIFFIIGVLLAVSSWKRFIVVRTEWIVLCFAVWFVLFYLNVHFRNKDRNTPRPVYVANPR